MKIINKIILGSCAMLSVACSNDDLDGNNGFLDDNVSPNSPLLENLTPDKRLSAAETEIYRVITGDNQNYENSVRTTSLNQLGSLWTATWSANINNFTGAYKDEYTGNLTSSFYDAIWDWIYLKSGNLHDIKNYPSDDYDNHKAIAMILQSFYMQYIVDLYGDCPYSEAFMGDENPTPKYDNQKEVYRKLYDQLDAAIALIQNADTNDKTVGMEDAMMKGNMQNWIAFANTVKLRYLIRQSEAPDADIKSFVNSEIDKLRGAAFITSDVTVNPGYSAAGGDQQNPFYGAYGYNSNGNAVTARELVVASKFIAQTLNSTSDPRRSKLFIPNADGNVEGIRQGTDKSAETTQDPSIFGPGLIPTDTEVGSAMDGYVMLLSEAKFLLAEAQQRWGGFPQSVEDYFNEGIQASFARYDVADGYNDYIANIDNVNHFGLSATSNKIEAIVTQKWLALLYTNGMEAYLDQLRTGYPETWLPVSNTDGRFPKRLLYPSSEVQGNAANVPVVSKAEALSKGAFWVPN